MKGPISIRTVSKRLQYDFTLHRKYTVIKGDSATGKTTLYSEIQKHDRGDKSIQVLCKVPYIPASSLGRNWARDISELHASVIFIDEDSTWVKSEAFAKTAKNSDHYYVLINRDPLVEIPYSVREIYKIKSSGKYHTLVPIYQDAFRGFRAGWPLAAARQRLS